MPDYTKLSQFADDEASGVDYNKLAKFEEPKSVGERVAGALPLTSDYVQGAMRGAQRGMTRMSEAVSDIGKEGFGPMNMGKLALGGLEYVASPFEGAGNVISNPIRRSLGGLIDIGGVDPAEIAANTADLAPMMLAPVPGVKAAEGLAAGASAVAGEAPAAMSAVRNAIPYIKSLFSSAPAVSHTVSNAAAKSDLLPGETLRTSHNPFPTGWYERQFRGGDEVPALPPMGAPEPQQVVGPKTPVGTSGPRQRVLSEDYVNRGERPTLRTSHLPRVPEAPANEGYFQGAISDEMNGANVPTDVPIGMGQDPRVSNMYVPNIRNSSDIDPDLAQQIKDNYFKKRQTGAMRAQTDGGMPWAPTREPVGDPLDELYSSYFNPNEFGGGSPPSGTTPKPPFAPNMEDVSNDNLDNVYRGFFNKDLSPRLSTPYRQAPIEGAEPLPAAPKPTPTPLPQTRGAQSVLDNPLPRQEGKPERIIPFTEGPQTFTGVSQTPNFVPKSKDKITSIADRNPERYYDWDDKNPALFGNPADYGNEWLDKLPKFGEPGWKLGSGKPGWLDKPKPTTKKLGPVDPSEVPPLAQDVGQLPPIPNRPAPPAAADFGPHKVGDEVEIVHNIAGQEHRAPGGRIVELISKHEPVFNKATRGPSGEMPNRVSHENRGYAKLEDGREIPVKMLQTFKSNAKSVALGNQAATKFGEAQAAHEAKSASQVRFETLRAQNKPFAKYTEDKPQDTDEEIEALMDAYFPNSGPAKQRANKKIARAQNEDPSIKQILKDTGTGKTTEISDTHIQAVNQAIDASAGARVYYTDLMHETGLSRSALDKVIDHMIQTDKRMYRKTAKDRGPYIQFHKKKD